MIFSLPLIILVLWFQSYCCVTHSHITKEKAHSYLFSWSFFLGQFCWHLLMTIKNIICSCIISTSQKHFRRSKDLLLRRKHSKITRTWEISLSTCSDILMSSKTVNGWLIFKNAVHKYNHLPVLRLGVGWLISTFVTKVCRNQTFLVYNKKLSGKSSWSVFQGRGVSYFCLLNSTFWINCSDCSRKANKTLKGTVSLR